MVKRLSQNTLILLVSNVGSAILSFLLAVLIGRYYGEDGLGIYASVLAWIFPLSFIVEFGFGTLMTRDIAQQPDLAHHYLQLTWQFRYGIGSLIMLATCILSPLITSSPIALIISSPLILTLPAYGAYTAIFRAYQRMLPIAFLNLGMLIAQVVLTVTVILAQVDLLWLFIINTVTSFGQLVSAWWIYRRYFYVETPISKSTQFSVGEGLKSSPTKAQATFSKGSKIEKPLHLRDLIRQARPFAVAGILSAIQARFSILWLEVFSTPTVVGLFVASLRFIDGTRMIPNALFGAVYPALSAISDNRPALHRLFIRVLLGLGGYGVLIAGVLWLFGGEILSMTFGNAFIRAESALVIMGMMLIPSFLRSGWTLYWYAIGRENAVNRILIINLLILITTASLSILIYADILQGIVQAMLYTEVITLFIIVISEIYLWQTKNNSSSTV